MSKASKLGGRGLRLCARRGMVGAAAIAGAVAGVGPAWGATSSMSFNYSKTGMSLTEGNLLPPVGIYYDYPLAKIGVGSVVNTTLFGKWGAEVSLGANIHAGPKLTLYDNGATVDVNYPNAITFTTPASFAGNGPFTIGVQRNVSIPVGQDFVKADFKGPGIDLNAVVQLNVGAVAQACAGGCVGVEQNFFSWSTDNTLVSLNKGGNGKITVFGTDLGIAKQSITIPLTTAKSPLVLAGEQYGAGWKVQYGTVRFSFDQTTAKSGSSLSASALDPEIFSVNADILGLATIAAGSPVNPFDARFGVGPVTLQAMLLSLQTGVSFGLQQNLAFTPKMKMVMHSSQDVNWSGPSGSTLASTYTVDVSNYTSNAQSLNVNFTKPAGVDDATFAVYPEFYMDLGQTTLHDNTKLTVGPNFTVQALKAGVSIKGFGLSLGPLVNQTYVYPAYFHTLLDRDLNLAQYREMRKHYYGSSFTTVKAGPKDFGVQDDADVSQSSVSLFGLPTLDGSLTLRSGSKYNNINALTLNGLMDVNTGSFYFGKGLNPVAGILNIDGTSTVNVTGPTFAGVDGTTSSTFVDGTGNLATGTFYVAGAMRYKGNDITKNTASLTISGAGSITNINGGAHNALANLARNDGVLSIDSGATFSSNAAFTNNGLLNIGQGSTFVVNGFTNLNGAPLLIGGILDTSGPAGTALFGPINGSGKLTGIDLTLQKGQIAYSGNQTLLTNAAAMTFIGTGTPLPFNPDAGAVYLLKKVGGVYTDGQASMNRNEGSITLVSTVSDGRVVTTLGAINNVGTMLLTGQDSITSGSLLYLNGPLNNTGAVQVDGNSSIRFNGNFIPANLNSNAVLTGGTWNLSGYIQFNKTFSNEARNVLEIGAGTVMSVTGDGGFENQATGSPHSTWAPNKNAGTLTFNGGQRPLDDLFTNLGTFALNGPGTYFRSKGVSNSGTVSVAFGAVYDTTGGSDGSQLSGKIIDTNGVLTGALGTLKINGKMLYAGSWYNGATGLYDPIELTTIGAGAHLILGGNNANPMSMMARVSATNYNNEDPSSNASSGLLKLQFVNGELGFGDGIDFPVPSLNHNFTINSGGKLSTTSGAKLTVPAGSNVRFNAGSTISNAGIIALNSTANTDAVLDFAGFTASDFTLAGGGVIQLGTVAFAADGVTRTWTGYGQLRSTTHQGRLVNQDNQIVGQGYVSAGTITNRGEIRSEGASITIVTPYSGNMTNSGKLTAASGTINDYNGMIIDGYSVDAPATGITLNNFEGVKGGMIDVQGNLFLNKTTVVGGQMHVAEQGQLNMLNGSMFSGVFELLGRVTINPASTNTIGGTATVGGKGWIDIQTDLNNVAAPGILNTQSGGVLTNNGLMTLKYGNTIGGPGALVNGGSIVAVSASTVTIGADFSQTAAGGLELDYGTNCRLTNASTTLSNAGTIYVGSQNELTLANSAATLTFTGNKTLVGGGYVLLGGPQRDGGGNITTVWWGTGTITGEAGTEVLTNQDNTIQGVGNIGNGKMAITNGTGGTIRSMGSGNVLVVQPNVSGFRNDGGIVADTGSQVRVNGTYLSFSGATLQGGRYDLAGWFRYAGVPITTNQADLTLRGVDGDIKDLAGNTLLAGLVNNAGKFAVVSRTWASPGAFNNAGTLTVGPSGTFTAPSTAQFSGSTLAGGTWNVMSNSSLSLAPVGSITTNNATVLLSGPNSNFAQINGLTTNNASFSIDGGRGFTTAGALSTFGVLTAGAGSLLTVTGNLVCGNGTIGGDGTLWAMSSATLAGSTVTKSGQGTFLVKGALTLSAGTKLDLTVGRLGIDYTGASPMASLRSRLIVGRNGTDANLITRWDGPGIASSTARSQNLVAGFDLYSIGLVDNASFADPSVGGTPIFVFGAAGVDQTSVLARMTYSGDADLNGKVDGDDYALIDNAFNGLIPNFGWLAGDFNYDGNIDVDDYALIDSGFLFQTSQLAAAMQAWASDGPTQGVAAHVLTAAVPEPTTLGVVGVGCAVGLLRRRRGSAWRAA